jgi:protease-4
MVLGKGSENEKAGEEKDPHLTPWEEEEKSPSPHPMRKSRERGLRDWLALGMAVLLVVYIVSFLFAGVSSSPGKSNGFFVGGGNVAWIPIQGEISPQSGNGSTGYLNVIAALDAAENDSSVSVVFLDIDSPGGSVVSSKQIVSRIRKMEKPAVSWIGELGASGAYYIASASDYVMADSDSITGSIGVISRQPNVKELMDKLGIKMEDITTGKLKGIGSPFNELTDEEKQVFQVLVNQAFESFVSDVKEFRGEKLDAPKFDAVLDGRILSGKQALEIGLVDETGTREQAIQKAGKMGEIEGEPHLIPFIEKEFSLADLFFSAGASFGKGIRTSWDTEEKTAIEAK